MKRLKVAFAVTAGVALIPLIAASRPPVPSFDQKLDSIVSQHRFSIAGWEIKSLINDIKKSNSSKDSLVKAEATGTSEYFSLTERIRGLKRELAADGNGFGQGDPVKLGNELGQLEARRAAITPDTESTIAKQIEDVLAEQGIGNPFEKYLKLSVFPPVNFKLQTPPHLLVISPRDKIENMKNLLLRQDITLDEMESIENQVEQEGVSTLVLELGGLATAYPTFVTNNADLRFTINAAVEEWLHQYLFFKPLGFRYALDTAGIRPDYQIAIINETVAGMVSREIGAMVYERYYRTSTVTKPEARPTSPPAFDFNREMREIRKAVDAFLAQGQVEQAEQFMEEKRLFLASKGYHIRKLNQAYFAFYGTYGDHPMSVSPIGTEVRQLRAKAASLKDFLETASMITVREDLQRAAGKAP
ncbi:MAG: hypothetical protein HYX79_02350 [Chloroflexi bacterium]|nr:hypothetical protein [Chloroflexota bacterium]